jgi:TetR/AcrR family transcriptional regulator, regulator of cefoperazone and chloramphenicol sensitivity
VRLNSPAPDDATRHQLLEAAGAVFAETGFRAATVREICRRARANIAAVNYHFGDKEMLYAEVLRHSQQKAVEKYPPLLDVGPDAAPEKKLRAFVLSLLLRIFDKGATAWHGKLMSREMIEPTAALDSLVEERIRPMAAHLQKIIAEILGCPPKDERVRLCSFSVVSQCVFYHHCQPVVLRLFPKQAFDHDGIARLADHITCFSLAAMKNFPKLKKTKSK